jgi:parallel beta-helix repeat protein
LDFYGNKGNIGTTRNPVNTVYNSQNVIFDTCRWISCEGICLNVSTDPNGLRVLNCTFYQCGGAVDNSDGYRNQAIAFSGASTSFAVGIYIIGNYFYAQGLDCISLANCNDVIISNNIAEDSYSFLYNNPLPYRTVNLTVTGNAIRNTDQGSLSNAVNPVAIDLPYVSNCTIVGNSIYKCAQSGIGIFEGSSNIVIDGNTLLDCGISPVSWVGGISVGGGLGTASNISEVVITDNTILSTGVFPAMKFGILIGNDIEALTISENNIVNAATSKYGYFLYTTVPTLANTYALTTNANTSATTLINDFDAYTQTITNWRKANTLTGYYFNGTKVVGIQQGAIANSADATVNAILAALRAHGLIAT